MRDFRPLIVGNWKMNGLASDLAQIERIAASSADLRTDIILCPPATLLMNAAKVSAGSRVLIGAQDCSAVQEGAFTGDISPKMIADSRGNYVIVGHSERRRHHNETDVIVKMKAEAALGAGLIPIVCVGETESEYTRDETLAVLERQLKWGLPVLPEAGLVIAYEPVWAIGSGRVPDNGAIERAHMFIRDKLSNVYGMLASEFRVIYGGSVGAKNAPEILSLPPVDGILVGGASLSSESFLAICRAVN